jgi:ABC-type transport system involved in cytochrome c biogenesis ATPase subunit
LEGTAVSRFLAKLVPATALNDLPSEAALCALAAWSPQDQTTLDELIAQSKTDPQAMRRLREEAKQALTTLKEEIAAIEQRLGVSAIEDLGRKHDDAVAKRGAADATAHDLFRAEPIPNVGTESWRQMFLYAREFAASVFPEAAPPQIATAGKCVLCQQDTDKQAADRLAAFDRYLSGKSAEEAAAAERTLAQAIASVTTAPVKRKQDVDSVLAGYAALTAASKQNAASIAAFFEKAAARLNALQQLIAQGAFEKLATLDPLPASPAATIDKERQSLTTEAQQLEQAERDEAAMRDRALRLAELIDRKKLSQEVEGVVERRNKLEERHRVGACRAQCRLTAITQQITNRRREILTPSLKQALQDQLKALQLTHLHVNLEDRGELGDSIVEVSLSAQQRIANNSEVLSEGEQRGLALACFFAELKEIGRDHGIIVDDPVSSLDHTRMQAVARRLAEEAATGRQVIVFSHNILFHYMLKTEARCAKVGWQEEWMTSLGDGRFGIIDDAQKPWQMKPVSERLTEIDQSLKALAKGYDPKDEKLRGAVVALYTNLRTTWERVVEEILFNRVIQRFRPEIMTQSLKAAYFDPEKDYPVLFEGMKRASHYSGHDAAEDLPTELPPLADIERDIKDLHDFSTQARERKKKFEKALGDYDAGIKPVLL